MKQAGSIPTPDESNTGQRIVDAAMSLFFRYGYSRVAVDDIVRELGISKKTVYNHFGGKAEILTAGIDRFARQFQQRADEIVNDPDLSLRQKLNTYLQHIGTSFSSVTKDFFADLKRTEPAAYGRINAFRRDMQLRYLTQLVDEGVRVGYIRDDTSRQLAIMMFISTVQQLTDADFLEQFPAEMTRHIPSLSQERIDQVMSILLRGILTEKFYRE
ncbi:transcriptional regulator, TetR family [Fibrella aestuarina BUZ 2]|uniref:Transcriptional regulator, TetR family n=1 Tax=Fibrella aestuarina BUZ 2 TaxID=1166018 RepID=I0KG53_9BACT|nr:TetR/AcrR family transcriptional regulator [Fibrella aestuarina]CCH03106.1 transcriptional regulator, TetR family [Fibrella aestuarina BUZ 2]